VLVVRRRCCSRRRRRRRRRRRCFLLGVSRFLLLRSFMNFKPFSLELNLLLLPPAVVAVVAVAPVMVTRNANDA